jgi:hypothetical protein
LETVESRSDAVPIHAAPRQDSGRLVVAEFQMPDILVIIISRRAIARIRASEGMLMNEFGKAFSSVRLCFALTVPLVSSACDQKPEAQKRAESSPGAAREAAPTSNQNAHKLRN